MRMRPTICWSDLRGARAGVWGLGVEGQANLRKLATLGADPVLVDDHPPAEGPGGRPVLATGDGGLDALAAQFPPPDPPTIEALLRPVGEHWIPDAYAADDLLV